MVLLDWGNAGLAPLGVEAQALSAGALATLCIPPAGAAELDRGVFEAYCAGLGARDLNRSLLRFAHCAAGSLLWAFPVAGRILRAAVDPDWRTALVARNGLSFESILEHRAGALGFLLELAREALDLRAELAPPQGASTP